ncbi:hypothetical protein INR49_009802, partial [Caranx melampygus]
MPTLPNLNSLGKLCSSSRSHGVDRVRVKRKSSVKRMSIIEDGHVAEVLYLIPKQYMEQLPYLNPNDYYLSERLNDVATEVKFYFDIQPWYMEGLFLQTDPGSKIKAYCSPFISLVTARINQTVTVTVRGCLYSVGSVEAMS